MISTFVSLCVSCMWCRRESYLSVALHLINISQPKASMHATTAAKQLFEAFFAGKPP